MPILKGTSSPKDFDGGGMGKRGSTLVTLHRFLCNSHIPTPIRYAISAVDKQRQQLDRLFKHPEKPVFIPPPPEQKTIRPPRDTMKNVQGSTAGAGSGEFHVYKAGRRREYERLAMLQEESRKESDEVEFERRRAQTAAISDAKTAKNRNKRQRKKGRAKPADDALLKKRRLVNGEALTFRQPGEDSDTEEEEQTPLPPVVQHVVAQPTVIPVLEGSRITIVDED